MIIEQRQEEEVVLRTEHGWVRVWWLASDVVHHCYEGLASADFARPLIDELEGVVQQESKVVIFADMSGMTAYEPVFRAEWADWLARHRGAVAFNALATARVVQMGLDLIGDAVGRSVLHTADRQQFEFAVQASLVESKSSGTRIKLP